MPERPGDMQIEERINAGQCELAYFLPANSNDDMVTGINRSAMRQFLWHDRSIRRAHQSTSRDSVYQQPVVLPSYVISSGIRLGNREWSYKTPRSGVCMRRVFTKRDQAIELDLDETCRWLSASHGSPRHDEILSALTAETEDVNNQAIMQMMTNRTDEGQTILPFPLCNASYIPSDASEASSD